MLEWSKSSREKMNWEEAREYAENLDEGGHNDWRLPTVEELISIVDYSKFNPACRLDECHLDVYWTGSTCAGNPNAVWYVYFDDGGVDANYKESTLYVRCVREREEEND